MFCPMKHVLKLTALVLALAGPAQAACFADYKAKQDDPLRLHYGVAQISDCTAQAAQRELRPRLAQAGWELLNILSVFDDSGLEERKDNAGRHFLRY